MSAGLRSIQTSRPGQVTTRLIAPVVADRQSRRSYRTSLIRNAKHSPGVRNPRSNSRFRFIEFEKKRQHWVSQNNMATKGKLLTLESVDSMRDWLAFRDRQGHVGLVPTMGALHEGHMSLARQAAHECEDVVVSIYVNPTQFGENEDLSTYPRSLKSDCAKLLELNEQLERMQSRPKGRVRAVFTPRDSDMYPFGHDSKSRLTIDPQLTEKLEGASRPSFFGGVTTIVLKLLNIVQPHKAYFGQKDIQQLVVARRMIEEFHIPTELRTILTTREPDGLARSSRNLYLGERRRSFAPSLYAILAAGVKTIKDEHESGKEPSGGGSRQVFLDAALKHALELQRQQQALPKNKRVRFELEYVSFANPGTLEEVDVIGPEGAIVSGALILLPLEDAQEGEFLGHGGDRGSVRLIDNIVLGNARRLLGMDRFEGSR